MADRSRVLTGSPAVSLAEAAARFDAPLSVEAARRFPVRFTRHYLGLAEPGNPDDPVRRIAWPDPAELRPAPHDLEDPVGERSLTPVPYVVRKHRDRAVLLVTARCHVYCRFCFRRSFPDGAHVDPAPAALERAIRYCREEPELREVILSGGDPLVLPDATLARIVAELSTSPYLKRLRVHTRAPVHDPARITPALAAALAGGLPARVVTHFNHPRELSPQTPSVVDTLLAAGLPLSNQAVLLRGVNADADTLETLCRRLQEERIAPYYLHHPDPVPGGGAFYLTPEEGLEIYAALRERLGPDGPLPAYVIDPPDGSGKLPVEDYVCAT